MTVYPWHADDVIQFTRACAHLPPVFLVHGQAGIGKHAFVCHIIQALLCTQTEVQPPCTTCPACQQVQALTHPNLVYLAPTAHTIKIDEVRQAITTVQQTQLAHGPKIVWLPAAEKLLPQAANALLKTLEEPPGATLFILVTTQMSFLLPTVVSRCRKIALSTPPLQQAREWLLTQGHHAEEIEIALLASCGAPLHAHNLLQSEKINTYRQLFDLLIAVILQQANPSQWITFVKQADLYDDVLAWLMQWTLELLAIQAGIGMPDTNTYHRQQLKKITHCFPITRLFKLWDYCVQWKSEIQKKIHHNKELLAENILDAVLLATE